MSYIIDLKVQKFYTISPNRKILKRASSHNVIDKDEIKRLERLEMRLYANKSLPKDEQVDYDKLSKKLLCFEIKNDIALQKFILEKQICKILKLKDCLLLTTMDYANKSLTTHRWQRAEVYAFKYEFDYDNAKLILSAS